MDTKWVNERVWNAWLMWKSDMIQRMNISYLNAWYMAWYNVWKWGKWLNMAFECDSDLGCACIKVNWSFACSKEIGCECYVYVSQCDCMMLYDMYKWGNGV